MVSAGDLLWAGLILLFLYPYFLNWWLDRKKTLFMRVLGRQSRAQIITLIHTSNRLSFLGFTFFRMIDMSDMEDILDAIRSTPKNKPIDLILHVTGGMVLSTTQIARALKAHPARTRVIIPYYAMSGGTLISLGADEIVMAENAILGPLDPQLLTFKGPIPVNTLKDVVKKKGLKADDETLMLASVGKQATQQIQDVIIDLLKDKVRTDKAKKIANFLTTGGKTHDYPISPEEAKKLGLPVKVGVRPEVFKLLEAYKVYKQPGIDVLYR